MANYIDMAELGVPVLAYGHNMLRRQCADVEDNDDALKSLIAQLWSTLNVADGVGLTAPQINSSCSAFVVNSEKLYNNLADSHRSTVFGPDDQGIKETFIYARIIDKSDKTWSAIEGCLSIPGIDVQIDRPWNIYMEYLDASFHLRKEQFSGYTARIIQHEFDHTNGVLMIDYLSSFSRKLIDKKLQRIIKGKVKTAYPIKFIK